MPLACLTVKSSDQFPAHPHGWRSAAPLSVRSGGVYNSAMDKNAPSLPPGSAEHSGASRGPDLRGNKTIAARRRQWTPAAGSPWAWVRFLLVAAGGVTVDLWAKHAAGIALGGYPGCAGYQGRRIVLIPHVLALQATSNGGAVFGFGQGWSLALIAVSVVAMAFVVYVFMSSFRRQWVMHIALGLILAGAAGNLYDRIFNHGQVRDFIHVLHYWPWIFNPADSMLCIGVPLLILCWRFQSPLRRES